MKRTRTLIPFFLWITLFCFHAIPLSAQEKRSDEKTLLFFIAKDTVEHEIMGYFYRTQSHDFHDPVAPRFIMASRNQNFILGLGGYVLLRMYDDFGGICDNGDYSTMAIPVPNAGNPRSQFKMDAGSSRIFMKVIGNTDALGQLVGYIEGDFGGSSYAFRLRQAYIHFLGFTLGQTLSTFIDPRAVAPSLDQNGAIASYNLRTPMVRFTHTFKSCITFAAAAELPVYSGTYSGQTESASATVPDLPCYIQYGKDPLHLRLSAVFRNLSYKDLENGKYRTVFGAGGKISTNIKIAAPVSLYGFAAYGKGISTYMQDFAKMGLDILPDADHSGKMMALKSASYYGALKLNYSKKLYSTFAYNYCRLYPDASYRNSSLFDPSAFYKHGQAISASMIWEFIPEAFCGLEYWRGRHTVYNGDYGKANRIYAVIRYNF